MMMNRNNFLNRFFVLFLLFSLSATKTWAYEIVELALKDVPDTYKKKGYLEVIFDASRQEVFDIITDFENFAEFMPRNDEIDMIERTEQYAKFNVEIDMPFPISNIDYGNHVKLFPDEYRTEFSMIPGSSDDVKNFNGQWRLTEAENGRTHAMYEVLFIGTRRYPGFIENKATRKSLKKMAKAVSQQIDQRYATPE